MTSSKPQFVGKKVTIGELGKTQSGGTPSSKHPEFFNGSIPWIGTTALNGKFLGKNDAVKLITEEAVAKSATKIVPEKSIMVGIRVGVGKVAINAVPMCTSQDIVSIVGIDEASWNKEYISLALQYKAPLLAAQAQGATIAGITSKTLKAIEIPAIPINEQNRVVDILRKLENQVGFVRKQLCGLDALVKSRYAFELERNSTPFGTMHTQRPPSLSMRRNNATNNSSVCLVSTTAFSESSMSSTSTLPVNGGLARIKSNLSRMAFRRDKLSWLRMSG